MEFIISQIENLLWSNDPKKSLPLVSALFTNYSKPLKAFDHLIDTSKKLIDCKYITEAVCLLNCLKTFSLTFGEVLILIDVKNLLSYCYRLKKQFFEAIQECKDSIDICRSKPELSFRLPALYLNLSSIFREDIKNYNKARIYAKASYEVSKKLCFEYPNNRNFNRNLVASILTLGQIEETLKNKEKALMWYLEGTQMNNIDLCSNEASFNPSAFSLGAGVNKIDKDMLAQLKSRIYNISIKNHVYCTPDRRSISTRQSFNLNPNKRIHSKLFSKPYYDSANSSVTTSSQFSTFNPKLNSKPSKKNEKYVEKICKIQAWVKMMVQKRKYLKIKPVYDYFIFRRKEISRCLYFVSVYRNVNMQKQRFLKRKLNSVIKIEAISLDKPGRIIVLSCDLNSLCQAINIKQSETILKSNLNRLLQCVNISDGQINLNMNNI
jgi:hypothetical protein